MIDREPPAAAVAPLPFWQTLAEAGRILIDAFPVLVQLSALPLVLRLATDLYIPLITPPWQGIVEQLVFVLVWPLFADSWLRLQLLNDGGVRRFFPKLTRRHRRLAGYALLLSLPDLVFLLGWHYGAETLDSPAKAELLYWLAMILIGFIELHFAFVYPAAAVGERYGLLHAWRHGRSVRLSLFGLFLATAVFPFAALTYGLNAVFADLDLPYVWWLLWHLGVWIAGAVYLTAIALAFRQVTGWVPAPDPAVLERFE